MSRLDKIIEENSYEMIKRISDLDELSKDIKEAEKYLNKNCIPYFQHDELIWNEDRIKFKTLQYDRPFIEMPGQIRLKYLESFYNFFKMCLRLENEND